MSLPEPSNLVELIKRCCSNDRTAQEAVYNFYYKKMLNLIKKYIDYNNDDVHIILNDGFLKAFKKIDTYNYTGSFEGWLRKIMYRSVCNYIKANKNKPYNIELHEEHNIGHSYTKLNCDYLFNLINELPNKTKQVFSMYAINGYNHREIAYAMDITISTSKWHISNARKLLQTKLLQTG